MDDAARGEHLSRLLKEHGSAIQRRLWIPKDLQALMTVEDVMQEAYVDAFVSIEKMPTDGQEFRKWLATIAANNLRDAIRVGRALKRDAARRASTSSISVLYRSRASTPSTALHRADRCDLMRTAASSLPDPYQTAAISMLDDEPPEVIASRLDRSLGCTYVVMGRARKLLGELLRRRRSELMGGRR